MFVIMFVSSPLNPIPNQKCQRFSNSRERESLPWRPRFSLLPSVPERPLSFTLPSFLSLHLLLFVDGVAIRPWRRPRTLIRPWRRPRTLIRPWHRSRRILIRPWRRQRILSTKDVSSFHSIFYLFFRLEFGWWETSFALSLSLSSCLVLLHMKQ